MAVWSATDRVEGGGIGVSDDVEAALLGAIKRNRIDEARTRAKQEFRVPEGDRRV